MPKINNRILLVEAGSELEMGIPPNIAILVSALKARDFDVTVFSTNDYKLGAQTGDSIRVNMLQVPPASGETGLTARPFKEMRGDFERLLKERDPLLVGFSVTEATFGPCRSIMEVSKGMGYFTIAGGAFPTLAPEVVIANPGIDAVCIGEGEEALVELCVSLSAGKVDHKIKSFWFKTDRGMIKNPVRPVGDIDRTPLQDWTPWRIPPRASKPMAGAVNTTALIELSRGCPFKCSYCANSFLNDNFENSYRQRSVLRFIEEAAYLKDRHDIGFIYICSETMLTASDARLKEFVDRYRRAIGLPFWCETRPEFINRSRIRHLKEAGLKALNVGVESGNAEFRRSVLNRNISDDMIIRNIRDAVSCDVRVGANVIIGFPGQKRDDIFESIRLIREARPSSTMVHLFQPYVKTPLRDECVRRGLIPEDYICGDYRMDAVGTGALTAGEIVGLQRTFNLYVDLPAYRWHEIEEAESLSPAGDSAFVRLAEEYQMKHFGRTSLSSVR